jgi:hypothetical protein
VYNGSDLPAILAIQWMLTNSQHSSTISTTM